MDLDRYYELRTLLNTWKARLAEALRQKAEASPEAQRRLQALYDQEGSSDSFDAWLSLWCRQAAIQWILRVLFLRVLEDRGLLGVERIRTSDGQRIWGQLTHNLGAASYLLWCCRDAAYLLPDLFGPTEFDFLLPDDDLIQRFFDDVWRRPDSNRSGWLRFDFRPDTEHEDEGFQTRFIGDLYQELDSEIRERHALLQTPHFVAQFILEHTLLKRFEEKDFRTVTLIDPTCGSGHFLVDAFGMFVQQYEQALNRNREQLTVHERSKIARQIIEEHLFGCDINPYASALARFRLILAACDYARPASLQDLRNLKINIVTIDSLIPYEKLLKQGTWGGTQTAKILGHPDDIQRALPVLQRRYDVVVGNPPYILASDPIKRDLYREHYASAYSKFGLSAPFTERFLHLAMEGGFVGLINSNAFARRLFGKVLIEQVLPQYDLQAVLDLSGAYIPGHGTPTLIMFARRQLPSNDTVIVLSNIKGEPGTPADPSKGEVWKNVVKSFSLRESYTNEYVDLAKQPRKSLAKHPWQFGGSTSRLTDKLSAICQMTLGEISDALGIILMTNADEVFRVSSDFARRKELRKLKPFVIGEGIRDWYIQSHGYAIYPYTEVASLINLEDNDFIEERNYLEKYKTVLNTRVVFSGGTYKEAGKPWYSYHQISVDRLKKPIRLITFAFISTHNHFVFSENLGVFNRSAQIIRLKNGKLEEYAVLCGILNSSVSCLFIKELCFNKGAGEDSVRDRYEISATTFSKLPIPEISETHRQLALNLVQELGDLAIQLGRVDFGKILEKQDEAYYAWNSILEDFVLPHSALPAPFVSTTELQSTYQILISLCQEIRARMIFLQEEMDWLTYEVYGLITKAPLAEDFLNESEYKAARLELGQRPFELAGKGYQGDWPAGYQPAPLPDFLRPLTEARIAQIQSNPDIALLEDPLYKRRWIPPDYEKEFSEAASWWLAEKLEFALEQYGKPISLREWARLLADDERVNAVLEVLTGSPSFDRESELFKVVKTNTVSNRPEHIFNLSGLRKYINSPRNGEGILPEYESKDFSDPVAWRIRGKLNIPRERFIAYREFDSNWRGETIPDSAGPWFGWAGWNAVQRADTLANLLERANRAGWEANFRQCGLRAALRDLLPELKDLPPAERSEFEAIATACGIGLETRCYCQAFKLAFSQREPCAPGVSAEILDLKPLEIEPEKPRRGRRKGPEEPAQLPLDLE